MNFQFQGFGKLAGLGIIGQKPVGFHLDGFKDLFQHNLCWLAHPRDFRERMSKWPAQDDRNRAKTQDLKPQAKLIAQNLYKSLITFGGSAARRALRTARTSITS